MKYTKRELCSAHLAEYGEDANCYSDDIDGYLDEIITAGDSQAEGIVVFERDGAIWGFDNWSAAKWGEGFNLDYGLDSLIDCYPMESFVTTSYRKADPRKPRILWAFVLVIVCNLRWEIREEDDDQKELWTWFPYEDPNLLAAGYTDSFIVTNIPLDLS